MPPAPVTPASFAVSASAVSLAIPKSRSLTRDPAVVAPGEEQVRRLDVPVHDRRRVRALQAEARLCDHPQRQNPGGTA